jgi:hypothetical protein
MRPELRLGALLIGALAVAASPGCGTRARPTPSEAVAPAPAFQDLTRESGLAAFTHTDGGSGRRYFVEQIGSGLAIFDFDGDGWQDVYLCSGAALPGYKGKAPGNALFRNRGDGTFENVTDTAGVRCGKYSIGAAAGDYNNDGHVDLYITCFGPNALYRNNGNGTFTDVTAAAGVADPRLGASAAWGDIDGDGFLDLYVANYTKYRVEEDLFCSKFEGHKSYCGPTLYDPEEDTLYRNNGDATFTDVSVKAGIRDKSGNGLAVLWLDYDDDGRQDIFVANDQTPNFLWRNEGGGRFREVGVRTGVAYGEEGTARAGMGVDSGDFDNDGRLDIVVTNFSEESNGLWRNEGAAFRDVAFERGIGAGTLMYLGFGTGFLDYDRDGRLDLFFTNGHVLDDIEMYSDAVTWAQPCQLFRNLGERGFEDVSGSAGVGEGTRVGRGTAFGDVDNDGRTDVIVSVLRGTPWYLHNEAAPNAGWLGVRLKAASGNPQGVGAKVWVRAGGVTQRRDVRAGGSYASTSDLRPLFGLGSNRTVDELRVDWPSGRTSTVKAPALNQYVTVEEPAH